MSGLLPLGDLAHTVFISCQMLFLIILSFPVVPPPRQRRPPHLLPLAPCLSPRGSESPIPFKSTYSPSPTAPFFVLILISLLGAAPTLFTLAALCWLTCLGKVRSGENFSSFWSPLLNCSMMWELHLYTHSCSWDKGRYVNMENITASKGSHNFHVDHRLGTLVSFSNIPTISGTKWINIVFYRWFNGWLFHSSAK